MNKFMAVLGMPIFLPLSHPFDPSDETKGILSIKKTD